MLSDMIQVANKTQDVISELKNIGHDVFLKPCDKNIDQSASYNLCNRHWLFNY